MDLPDILHLTALVLMGLSAVPIVQIGLTARRPAVAVLFLIAIIGPFTTFAALAMYGRAPAATLMTYTAVPSAFVWLAAIWLVRGELGQWMAGYQSTRGQHARLQHILHHMPVMLCAFDSAGRVTFWNAECEAVTGFSAATMVGHPDPGAVLEPEDATARSKMMRDWMQRTDFYDWEWRFRAADGSRRLVSWSNVSRAVPIDGWVSWGVGVDLTARMRRHQDELALNRTRLTRIKLNAVGHLASGIAHEINSPLMGLMNYGELLTEFPDDSARVREYSREVVALADQISRITGGLLAFSRQDEGRLEMCSLKAIIQNATEQLEQRGGSTTRIEVSGFDGLPPIEGRAQELRRLFDSLLQNAHDAILAADSPIEEQSILVHAELRGSPGAGAIQVTITDTGAGFASGVEARMLEPFYSSRDRGRGTGLGLPISLRIVEGHGGQLSWRRRMGRTEFICTLPLRLEVEA